MRIRLLRAGEVPRQHALFTPFNSVARLHLTFINTKGRDGQNRSYAAGVISTRASRRRWTFSLSSSSRSAFVSFNDDHTPHFAHVFSLLCLGSNIWIVMLALQTVGRQTYFC